MGLGLLLSGSKGAELRSRHPDSHWKTKLNTTEMQESQLPGSLGQEGHQTPLQAPGEWAGLASCSSCCLEAGEGLGADLEASIPKAKLKRFVIVSFIFLFLFTLLI